MRGTGVPPPGVIEPRMFCLGRDGVGRQGLAPSDGRGGEVPQRIRNDGASGLRDRSKIGSVRLEATRRTDRFGADARGVAAHDTGVGGRVGREGAAFRDHPGVTLHRKGTRSLGVERQQAQAPPADDFRSRFGRDRHRCHADEGTKHQLDGPSGPGGDAGPITRHDDLDRHRFRRARCCLGLDRLCRQFHQRIVFRSQPLECLGADHGAGIDRALELAVHGKEPGVIDAPSDHADEGSGRQSDDHRDRASFIASQTIRRRPPPA